tara:strand:+ start:45265 stop:45948 length:684 start_codon:yes stop_codon:yes gene_type:complete
MCGRFNVIDNPGLRQLLQDLGIDLSLPQRVNVAPTEKAPLVTGNPAERNLEWARWWFTPGWAPAVDQKYSMFNARAETLASSRAFSHAFKCQRGLVPMSSFIEWRAEEGVKQPWLVSAGGDAALAAAALWDVWEKKGEAPLLSLCIVTTAAAPEFAPWHSRMPVLLAADEWDQWLDNTRTLASDHRMFRSELKMPLQLSPLSRSIGNARHKDAELLAPLGETVELGA